MSLNSFGATGASGDILIYKKVISMKKYVFIAMGLFSLITLTSCDNEDNSGISNEARSIESDNLGYIYPIQNGAIYAAIDDFFQRNYNQGEQYKSFFGESEDSQCLVINQIEDLNLHFGDSSFPEIDFNKYTLIVGQEIMPEGFYTILRQELYNNTDNLQLNIYVPQINGGYAMIQHLFYWGLYPKLCSSDITVNIIKEQV